MSVLKDNVTICYCATHSQSGKQYIGISSHDLATRRSWHESQSARGNKNLFHSAIREFGKDNFTWNKLAEGEGPIMRILERVLIAKMETYCPNGFNSTNEATEFELPLSDETLSFFEEMDSNIQELDREMDMIEALRKSLDDAQKSERLGGKTKELIRPLIDHLKSGDYLLPA